MCRQNHELEQASQAIQKEKDRLEKEALSLAQQLQAVLSDKFVPQQMFDADTPIDKTLKMMQFIIEGGLMMLNCSPSLPGECCSSSYTWQNVTQLTESFAEDRVCVSPHGAWVLALLVLHSLAQPTDSVAAAQTGCHSHWECVHGQICSVHLINQLQDCMAT